MDFIIVLAKIKPKEGCFDSIVELSDELIFESLQDEGNIEYQLLKSINEETLTFVEKWQSLDCLKKHMATPHFINFNEDCEEFIEKMTIEVIDGDELTF